MKTVQQNTKHNAVQNSAKHNSTSSVRNSLTGRNTDVDFEK